MIHKETLLYGVLTVAILLQFISVYMDSWGVKKEEIATDTTVVGVSGLKLFYIMQRNDSNKTNFQGSLLPPIDNPNVKDYDARSLYAVRFLVMVSFLCLVLAMNSKSLKFSQRVNLTIVAGVASLVASMVWYSRLKAIHQENSDTVFNMGSSYVMNVLSGVILLGVGVYSYIK